MELTLEDVRAFHLRSRAALKELDATGCATLEWPITDPIDTLTDEITRVVEGEDLYRVIGRDRWGDALPDRDLVMTGQELARGMAGSVAMLTKVAIDQKRGGSS